MKDELEIKWPWEMMWTEYADDFERQIKEAFPPDHELQRHELFPGIKWDKRPLFIVDDDTTGERIFMNFEKMKRWGKTKHKIPTMKVLTEDEVAAVIERDHLAECAKYKGHRGHVSSRREKSVVKGGAKGQRN